MNLKENESGEEKGEIKNDNYTNIDDAGNKSNNVHTKVIFPC